MYNPSAAGLKRDAFVHAVANRFINTFATDDYSRELSVIVESGLVTYHALQGDQDAIRDLRALLEAAEANVQN